LIVTLEKRFQDEQALKSGLELFLETKFRPEHHVTTIGHVISVPEILSDKPDNNGLVQQILPGDEVCFNYQVVFTVDDNGEHTNLVWHNGKDYWFVDYSQVFCVKRNGVIIPIGSHVIITPLESEAKETFDNSILILPDSMKTPVQKGVGIIKHIGVSLTHEPALSASAGDMAFFRPEIAQVYEMYGSEQVIIKQIDLLAIAKAV